jgi:hypothetical protein
MAAVTDEVGTATHAAQTGTLTSMAAGTTAIVGSGTNFDPEFTTSDRLIIDHTTAGWHSYDITAVTDDTHLTIAGGLVEAVNGETPYKQGSAHDFSTWTLWEASLSGHAGDDVTGEGYDDSAFDEIFTIDDGTPDSITLTVAAGERHDGTHGSGARIVRTGGGMVAVTTSKATDIEWLEFDWADNAADASGAVLDFYPTAGGYIRYILLHDAVENGHLWGIRLWLSATSPTYLMNSFIYNLYNDHPTTGNVIGIYMDSNNLAARKRNCHNVTCYKFTNDNGTGYVYGITGDGATGNECKNTAILTMDGSASGNKECFAGTLTEDYNMASDDSDGGANSIGADDGVSVGDELTSTTADSEDLHLKAGADAIDAGTDLGTTPTGVEVDIDGRDRDAENDTTDIGADEYVATVGFGGVNQVIGGGVIVA